MLRRSIIVILVIVCFNFIIFQPSTVQAQYIPQFQISSFVVRVDPTSLVVNGVRPPSGYVLSNRQSQIDGKVFSGRGTTRIKDIRFDLTFKNVKLKIKDGTLVATTGTVSGSNSSNVINYSLGTLKINVKPQSIRIVPTTAKAKVTITVPVTFFSSDTVNLSISSDLSDLTSDGSIYGRDFHGSSTLKLKDSLYRLRIRQEDAQSVRVGSAFDRPTSGISLKGAASREDEEVFSFDSKVSQDATATFNLQLVKQITAYPEIDYVLVLKTGWLKIQYGKTGLRDSHGKFTVDLTVPPLIKDETGNNIKLTDILLDTDKTDALYQKVHIPYKLKAGVPFLIEPVKDATQAYFPKWPLSPSPSHSSYPGKPNCDNLDQFLDQPTSQTTRILYNAEKRPGLTVLQGILYLTSPQITTDGSSAAKVKTFFSGAVTLTPWGLTGPLVGRGFSFVLQEKNIADGAKSNVLPRKTWEEILAVGTTPPQEPKERFQLAGLRILDMRVKEMRFCMNEIEEGKATLNYFVHFPFPSFIDLEFEDKTLNHQGLFTQAKGPVATVSLAINKQYAKPEDLENIPNTLPKVTQILPNPDTYILWAWRLPVSFADRGVTINYKTGPDYKAEVKVAIDITQTNNDGEILNSEIWLKPLYSSNSAIKSGVRFSANMDSKTGDFKLTGWDRDPFFARMYTKPGSERAVGFAVQLNDLSGKGVTLIEAESNPVSRSYDVRWEGSIQFPFFSKATRDAWKILTFEVKDLIPKLASKLQMTAENSKTDCTYSTSNTCTSQVLADPPLRVEVGQLNYSSSNSIFTITNTTTIPILKAFNVSGAGALTDLSAKSLTMSSFTNAMLTTSMIAPNPTPLDVGGGDAHLPGECGRDKWLRRIMKDWQPSTSLRDLVCYDQNATCVRGTCGACSSDYLFGTYEVRTRNCQDLTQCVETAIMSVTNAKYYQSLKKIDAGNTEVSVKSDEMNDSHVTAINIPSAQFAFSPDGRFMEGAFGATLSTVAASLPYEGELRFKLDTQCGYYYFQGAGSFTYYVRFSGQTFIMHAPYKFLTEPTNFIGVSGILEDLRIRALFGSVDDFTNAAGLKDVKPTTVISGVLTSGNVSTGANFGIFSVSAAIGPGLYLYQFNDGGQQNYRIGAFAKALASAGIDLYVVGIGVKGDETLATSFLPHSLTQLNTIFSKGDFDAKGSLRLSGCADCLVGHCEAWLKFMASYSTKSGFNLGGSSLDGDCGSGGCD